MNLTFRVQGKPTGKGRPKFARRGAFVHTYTPKATADYEAIVRDCFCIEAKAKGVEFFEGNISLHIYAAYKLPKSTPKKLIETLNGQPAPIKPDADNVLKLVADSLNGVAWADDNQVVNMSIIKRYTKDEPYIEVSIANEI